VRAFETVSPCVDECVRPGETVGAAALRLAEAKARDVGRRRPAGLVIGADTLVVCDAEIMGKPVDRRDAIRILTRLTRRPHRVVTGVFVLAPDGRTAAACSGARLRMRRMGQEEIERYVDTPGALDRAGVYALQEDDPNVEVLVGSPSAVMGLPVEALCRILREFYPQG